jgi:hypothetical protein
MKELKEFFIDVIVVTVMYWIAYEVSGNDKVSIILSFVVFNTLNIKQIGRDVERIKHD